MLLQQNFSLDRSNIPIYLIQDASKSNPVKNKEIEFSVQNDVSSSSFDGTFFHQSPDSGHDDTISSTLSRFRNANTWRSSACQFQLGDESGLNDDREKSEVIENSFHQENSAILATSPMPGSSLFADSVGSSRTNFSKHLPVVGWPQTTSEFRCWHSSYRWNTRLFLMF